jgi:transcriptional regulator with XRE-family HTH domain
MKQKRKHPKLNRVAEALAIKKLSQRELARRLGISPNAVNDICKQRAQPLDRLFQIAKVLDVPITDMINVDYKPDKPN